MGVKWHLHTIGNIDVLTRICMVHIAKMKTDSAMGQYQVVVKPKMNSYRPRSSNLLVNSIAHHYFKEIITIISQVGTKKK